jgi:hypothetical protein
MSPARFIAWTLLAAGGFALVAPHAAAQNPPLPKKNSTAVERVATYRDQRSIPKEELKDARAQFAAFAKYYADVIAHPDVWKASQEFKVDPIAAALIPTLEGPNGILKDLDRFLLEPVPGGSKVGFDQADYIRELGAALDAALKNLIEDGAQPQIVRINAARVLAHVARSGAPAHFNTVTSLLANANTRTEIKYYLFHAAAALLAAGDVNDIKVRKHAGDPKAVAALIKVLQDNINNPALLVAGLPEKADAIPADQLAVLGLVRRQAVRALAQTKFAAFPGADGKMLYPAHTMARIALGDPALVPAPGPAECAEAVIGLCNMAPVTQQVNGQFAPIKGYNGDVAVEAMLTGLVTFAGPRAANAYDRTLPWRSYATRLAEAMRNGRPLYDPDFEITQPAKYDVKLIPPLYEEMYKEVVPKVLAPMDKVDANGKPDIGATVELPRLRDLLGTVSRRPNRKTELFTGVPQTSINFAAPK